MGYTQYGLGFKVAKKLMSKKKKCKKCKKITYNYLFPKQAICNDCLRREYFSSYFGVIVKSAFPAPVDVGIIEKRLLRKRKNGRKKD